MRLMSLMAGRGLGSSRANPSWRIVGWGKSRFDAVGKFVELQVSVSARAGLPRVKGNLGEYLENRKYFLH